MLNYVNLMRRAVGGILIRRAVGGILIRRAVGAVCTDREWKKIKKNND